MHPFAKKLCLLIIEKVEKVFCIFSISWTIYVLLGKFFTIRVKRRKHRHDFLSGTTYRKKLEKYPRYCQLT